MDNFEYKKYTKSFPDILSLLNLQKVKRIELNKISRKLKSLNIKYDFLKKITAINVSDDILENNLKKYFKEIGYKNVQKVGKQLGKEDLRIIQDDKILIIETTGIKKQNPTDNKTRQITKHLDIRKKNGENIFGLFILHYENQKPIHDRCNNPFTLDQIKYAEAGHYGLTTTIQLVKAFKQVQTKELSFLEFDKKIHTYGYIKF